MSAPYYQHRFTRELFYWSQSEHVYRSYHSRTVLREDEGAQQLYPINLQPQDAPRVTNDALPNPVIGESTDTAISRSRHYSLSSDGSAYTWRPGNPLPNAPSGQAVSPTIPLQQQWSTSPPLSYHNVRQPLQLAPGQPQPTGQPQPFGNMVPVSPGTNPVYHSAANASPTSERSTDRTRSFDSHGRAPSQSGSTLGSIPPHKIIRNTSQRQEDRLDPRYKRRHSRFFQRGRVFKVWWPEPGGYDGDNDDATSLTDLKDEDLPKECTRDSKFREKIHSKIRWFIVVKAGNNKCTCVPIVTYRGQGVAKPGVNKSEHAVAYASRTSPVMNRLEAPMGDEQPMRRPICIEPDNPAEKLDPMSRIDYSRPYTVEHNVKAMAFGMVYKKSEMRFYYDFKAVFFGEPDQATKDESSEDDQDSDGSDGSETDRPDNSNKSKKPMGQRKTSTGPSNQPRANPGYGQGQPSYPSQQLTNSATRTASNIQNQHAVQTQEPVITQEALQQRQAQQQRQDQQRRQDQQQTQQYGPDTSIPHGWGGGTSSWKRKPR